MSPPVLESDVINPIYGACYRDPRTPPAGYLSPQPIFFLGLARRVITSLAWPAGAVTRGRPSKEPAGFKAHLPTSAWGPSQRRGMGTGRSGVERLGWPAA